MTVEGVNHVQNLAQKRNSLLPAGLRTPGRRAIGWVAGTELAEMIVASNLPVCQRTRKVSTHGVLVPLHPATVRSNISNISDQLASSVPG